MAKNTQQPELSMVDQVRIRREKLAQLQQEGQNPFAQTKFEFTSNSAEIKKNFEQMEGKKVSVSGPKCYLIDWLCSDDYNNTNRKSRRHIDMLWEAQKWRD